MRAACELALTQSPEFAQALLRYDREATGGGGGAGAENNASALADLYPIAARTALAAAARREGAGGGAAAGGENDNDADGDGENNNNRNPLAAAVAEALSALSSAKDSLAGFGAAAVGAMLEAGVHIFGWTRHLAQVARGEETGPWMRVEGGGGGEGRSARARARARSISSRARRPPRSFRPASLDEWVKLVTAVAMAVVAVIFVRRRARFAARGGGL